MKHAAAVAAVVFAGVVGLGWTHPFGNPRTEPQKGLGTLMHDAGISPAARQVLITKCADCHSNETRWPVYARIAPGSWLIERDITQARAKMNLSHWEDMSSDTKDVLIAKIIHETKEGEMPPLQYRVLHWNSRLTQADLAALRSMNKAALDEPHASAPGDATHGKLLFQKRCTGCHAIDGDREGPHLGGVFGRKAGTVPGFEYSPGLAHAGITWNEATLEKWLTDPDLIVPDTKMDFQVPKAQERTDLITYLRQGSLLLDQRADRDVER